MYPINCMLNIVPLYMTSPGTLTMNTAEMKDANALIATGMMPALRPASKNSCVDRCLSPVKAKKIPMTSEIARDKLKIK